MNAETQAALFLSLLHGDQAHGMGGSYCNGDDTRRAQTFIIISEEIHLDWEWLNFRQTRDA